MKPQEKKNKSCSCGNLDGIEEYHAEQSKPVKKENTGCSYSFMVFSETTKNMEDISH